MKRETLPKINMALALAAMAAFAGSRFALGKGGPRSAPLPGEGGIWDGRSSPNKRAPGARMANHRAAVKARNVKRHRAACRG